MLDAGGADRRQAAGHLAMVVFSICIGGSFSLGALAAPHIAPVALNALRFWLAAFLLLAVALVSTGGLRRDWFAAPWRYGALGLLYALYFVLMFEGLRFAQPVSLSAVFTLTPLMAAGFGWLLLRQRMTGRMALALVTGGIGALWVIFDADPARFLAFNIGRGEAIYFIGCVAHAFYTPLVRRLSRGEPTLVFTASVLFCGAAIATVFGWPEIRATDWAELPAVVWATIAYTAVFATAASATILQFASLRLPAAKVMAHTYMVPAWVILWELALGRAPPPALVMVGVGLSILALVMLLRDEDRPRSPA